MSLLVVSPHLDDAVLSIPATIAARVAAGTPVTVLTVFTTGTPLHAIRRAEDHTALARLGATSLHLGLLDAPIRRNIPAHYDALVLTPLPADDPDAATVHRALLRAIHQLAPTELLLPLAVGEHIDHRIVHALHAAWPGRTGFYADRPYADIDHAVQARLAGLGATLDGVAIAPSRAAADALRTSAARAAHLHAYLPPGDPGPRLQALAAPLLHPAPASGLRLRHASHDFSSPLRTLAVTAVQAYATELRDLFGHPDAVPRAYAEPYRESLYWRA